METIIKDLRFAIRMLSKNPGFTVVAVIALALGIGANTAIFTVVNAILLRPLPFKDPARLVMTYGMDPKIGQDRIPLSVADYLDWRSQNQVFESMAAFSDNSFNFTSGETPEQVRGARVTADFFAVLGAQAEMGRTFQPEEDRPGADPVVVVSGGFWRRQLGARPDVIGQQINLNSRAYTVVGVMPASFSFPEEVVLWTAQSLDPPARRGPYFMWGLGRLRPGATVAQARMEMDTVARRIQQETRSTQNDWTLTAVSLTEQIVGNVRTELLLLLAAVVFVLLIASANVANLLLSRAAAREKEIAIRSALGASRGRLVRQLLTESLLLAFVGGAVGLLLALWGVDVLVALSPNNIPRLNEVAVDGRVFGFTLLVSLSSGILFGLAPALYSSRLNLNESLKEGGRGASESFGRRRLRSALVVAEIALSLMLLIGAGLMIKSFVRLQGVNPGFNPENILTMQISLPGAKYSETSKTSTFYQQLLTRVESLPGVQSAGLAFSLPPDLLEVSDNYAVEEHPTPPGESDPIAPVNFVSTTFFKTLGIPLVSGRFFTDDDNPNSPDVVIISEAMAKRYFGSESPLGKRFKQGGLDRTANPWMEIVGVVGDVKYSGLAAKPEPAYYLAHRQATLRSMYLVVRTASDPASLAPAIRGEVWALDKEQPVARVRTMEELLSRSVSQPRFRTLLISVFAATALLLAAVGIYGVISYSVAQRTHEIGIRMALGARQGSILKMIVGQGLRLALIGTGVGLAGAYLTTRVLSSLLFGVSATDTLTFVGIPLLLTGVVLLASYVPARRATKVDPLTALRYE
ncbi:MAG TPA: ABC transporter permease [Blastocatellia bacterium]|jgi:putative ABC transport system permease protein|nr:ABC transporter permease [Blastocatellia bacterium]